MLIDFPTIETVGIECPLPQFINLINTYVVFKKFC